MQFIAFDPIDAQLQWSAMADAIVEGHRLPRAQVADSFVRRGADTLLTRSAWIEGLGCAVKAATVVPGNAARNMPTILGGMQLFDDTTGALSAVLDFTLVTKWKTATDSYVAARWLAPPTVEEVLIVGSGNVARSMVSAYHDLFPSAHIRIYSRNVANAQALVEASQPMFPDLNLSVVDDLANAVNRADVICTATMSTQPVVKGEWSRAGQHYDLIGAFRGDMREVDDTLVTGAKWFADSRETTLDHIGELNIPLEAGLIGRDHLVADYYDLAITPYVRGKDEITVCKNGGGAHLDLMVATAIVAAASERRDA